MSIAGFRAIVLTLYPEMFPGTLGHSLAGKALKDGLWSLEAVNIRDFATDRHKTVDDTPYGGGAGMVLKPDVVHKAVEYAKNLLISSPIRGEDGRGAQSVKSEQTSPHPNPPPEGEGNPLILYTTPRGLPFTQQTAEAMKNQDIIILCGRFEGVDQRVIDHHQMQEISLGDFVLSGGEIAAQAMLDAVIRLLPGVMGNAHSATHESFSSHLKSEAGAEPALSSAPCENQQIFTGATKEYACLLEYPQYTRPLSWNGHSVPDVLCSGNHKEIERWRLEQAKALTASRRPDLMKEKGV